MSVTLTFDCWIAETLAQSKQFRQLVQEMCISIV